MNEKIKVAIVGYGNIGQYALEAIQSADDFQLMGVVRRNSQTIPEELQHIKVVEDIRVLGHVDVALLCAPTRTIHTLAKSILRLGINTIDSFDIHRDIVALKTELDEVAQQYNSVAIVAAGWDPGADSIIRTLMLAMAPKGITDVNFGPGMSMGHSVAAKAIEGVKDAISITIPVGSGIHRRMVYVELAENADFNQVEAAIKADSYFCADETHVKQVSCVNTLRDVGHGVTMTHKGVSGQTHNQQFEYSMRINNPALTAQFMLSTARASMKQPAGAYTVIEIPPIDFLVGDINDLIEKLV